MEATERASARALFSRRAVPAFYVLVLVLAFGPLLIGAGRGALLGSTEVVGGTPNRPRLPTWIRPCTWSCWPVLPATPCWQTSANLAVHQLKTGSKVLAEGGTVKPAHVRSPGSPRRTRR